jgi:hypothetical protein
LIAPSGALAQAAPALSPPGFYNPDVGLSVGQVLGNGLAGRGVPVNDNLNTAKAVGSAAQTALDAASQLTGGGLRGKSWAMMLGLAAAGTAIAGTVWCFTTSYCWDQSADGKVHPQQNAFKNQPTGVYPAMDGKRSGWLHVEQGVKCYSTTLRGIAECSVSPLNSYRAQQASCAGTSVNSQCVAYVACSTGNDTADYCTPAGVKVNTFSTTAVAAADMPAQCQNGVANVATTGKISCGIPPQAPMPNTTDAAGYWDNLTPGQALDAADTTVPASVQAAPLSSGQIRDLANELWKQAAAQPGYSGVPYQPLTQAEADAAYNQALQQGLQRPTVGDLLSAPTPGQASNAVGSNASPGAATGVLQGADIANNANYSQPGVSVPTSGAPALGSTNYAPPASATATGPVTVNVTVNPKVDLGPDPGIGTPSLQDPPGWQQWYSRIKTAMPFIDSAPVKQFQAQGSYACPIGRGKFFDKDIVMDQHCTFLENYRTQIQTIMKLAWGFSVLVVILG